MLKYLPISIPKLVQNTLRENLFFLRPHSGFPMRNGVKKQNPIIISKLGQKTRRSLLDRHIYTNQVYLTKLTTGDHLKVEIDGVCESPQEIIRHVCEFIETRHHLSIALIKQILHVSSLICTRNA
uniref:Uncharacterized protein n=1 Tax=Glossina pallidipes TaxID=7398 RepID=A0A1A9ZJR6_GLOPL